MKPFHWLFFPVALTIVACSSAPPLTYQQVLNGLNKCEAFEMGTAEPQQHFGKPQASGNEMCTWKAQQIGAARTCVLAGRIYATPASVETGYGVWTCGRQDVVSADHNGWALCCPTTP